MRKGGERRVRHDVGAKAKSLPAADLARELAESIPLQRKAKRLIDDVAAQAAGLDDQLLESVLHELVRRALQWRKTDQ